MALSKKQKRSALILSGVGILGVAAALVLSALSDSIVFFYTPSEVSEKNISTGTRFRLGGLVADGSFQKGTGQEVSFIVTDGDGDMNVTYVGILPDLFREGQGVVAEGILRPDGQFKADTVLAKHDENYVPREVADALKEKGIWKDGEVKTQ